MKGNCRGLKLTNQILEIVERVTLKIITEQVDVNGIQFSFMPGYKTTDAFFIFR